MTLFRAVICFLLVFLATQCFGQPIESWQFNDAAGISLSGVANDAGAASFPSDFSHVVTDGVGGLQFTQGASATDNIFTAANLTAPNQSTGIFELSWSYASATLAGGASGDNVGFGIRDTGTNVDPFVIRLFEQSGTLRLQTRINNLNTELFNFGSNTLSGPLEIRAVADLDNDLLDVYFTENGGGEQSFLDISIPDTEFDAVRMIARTNNAEWGPTDEITVDYLTVSPFTPIGPPASLQVNTATGELTMLNASGADFDMDFYEITSPSSSLNPAGWNSLQDQDLPGFPAGSGAGDGWEELGLDASGDFDGNGIVDAADFTVWRDNLGGPESALRGNGDGSGIVDTGDYALFQSRFGSTPEAFPDRFTEAYLLGDSVLADNVPLSLGSGFAVGGTQDLEFTIRKSDGTILTGDVQYVSMVVPEPSTSMLLLFATFALGCSRRFRVE